MSREENIENIKEMTEKLNEVVTHPEFLKILQKIEDTPAVERMEYVSKYVTPSALAEKGIPMPKDFRITTRVFEDPDLSAAEYTEDNQVMMNRGRRPGGTPKGGFGTPVTICASIGFIVCATVGTVVLI